MCCTIKTAASMENDMTTPAKNIICLWYNGGAEDIDIAASEAAPRG